MDKFGKEVCCLNGVASAFFKEIKELLLLGDKRESQLDTSYLYHCKKRMSCQYNSLTYSSSVFGSCYSEPFAVCHSAPPLCEVRFQKVVCPDSRLRGSDMSVGLVMEI
jgi:hypothetical protein